MGLPQFYTDESNDLAKKREERRKRTYAQKNFSLDQRKDLFNKLSIDEKKKCLLNLKKGQPATPGDIEETWWNRKGKCLSGKELTKIKSLAEIGSSGRKYYCWKRGDEKLLLREFNSKLIETGKSFALVLESNDLALLEKGESFVEPQGFITFGTLQERKKR